MEVVVNGVSWFRGFRPGQREAVEEIVEHFNNGVGLVLLDAPTGTGKTLIAEAVRQTMEMRGLYLCDGIQLQRQFARDFPYAKVVMGRRNYRPLDPIPGAWGELPTCADCDYDSTTKVCTYCPEYMACPYTVAKTDALMATEVANGNYNYFLTEANGPGRFSLNFDLHVADEADVLENIVMDHVSIEISERMRKNLGLGTPRLKTKSDAWVEWVDESMPLITARLKRLERAKDLNERRTKRTLKNLLVRLSMIRMRPQGWVYTGYNENRLIFKPVMVDQMATEIFWDHGKRWLAMSASLISADEFIESMGYPGTYEVVTLPSPFPKKNRPVHYAPAANVVYQEKEIAYPQLGRAVKKILEEHPDERILLHAHSYDLTRFLRNWLLKCGFGNRVYTYLSSEEREKAIEDFERDTKGVLIASSLARGYDGKDDLVRVVVVCKVPYPYLGDKQVSTRTYNTPGGGTWYAVQTVRSIVQMVGRGVRHEKDFCVTYVLDEQFGRIWREWKLEGTYPERHKLLPDWFTEAIVWRKKSFT